jgi:23S rRNA pseudouridine1911/1915/1917 synthase
LNPTELVYIATAEDQDACLRNILARRFMLSQALLSRLKFEHKIRVNSQWARTSQRIAAGDVITIDVALEEENPIIPEALPLEIVYEDDDFLVVNKVSGMAVHPSKSGGTGTLANAVTHYFNQSGSKVLFRAVHRLDKDTSGLLLIAKNRFAQQGLSDPKSANPMQKRYIALVEGLLEDESGTISQPIACPDPTQRRRLVHPDGQTAVTHYRVLERLPGHTLISLWLETGRTHQIRVHMSHLGHPLCGDLLYGRPSPWMGRLALHADEIVFLHPRTGKTSTIKSPMPEDFREALIRLRQRPASRP